MRYARRLIAILVSCATWCIAVSSVAYATRVPDPGEAGSAVVTSPGSTGTPLWEFLAFVALAVLLAVAIVGLGYSLSRRMLQSSPRSRTPLGS